MTVTDVRAGLFALLDQVEAGEEIESMRHGRAGTRLTPVRQPRVLKGRLEGSAWSNGPVKELFWTGAEWHLP